LNKRNIAACAIILIIVTITICTFLFINKIFKINTPSTSKYPVRGVDVSSYQGKIDWNVLSNQGIRFAFIKATEGSSSIDKDFTFNYEQAMKTNLAIGAYHFFSYDSSGSAQADNYIATVPKCENMLPPVVDIEFYGDKEKYPPSKTDVTNNLTSMLKKLENYYGIKPIIYATKKSYKLYISGGYSDFDIWIRDVFFKPSLSDGRKWTFWQFTDKGKLEGYSGIEKYIDINVFYGSQQEFKNYTK
jgi:lysozyme